MGPGRPLPAGSQNPLMGSECLSTTVTCTRLKTRFFVDVVRTVETSQMAVSPTDRHRA